MAGTRAGALLIAALTGGCSLLVPGGDGLTADLFDAGQSDIDAGPDAGPDAEPPPADAGPCEGACDAAHCIGGACVGCIGADDCTSAAPFCLDNACVGCRGDDDCEAATPVCSAGNLCRGCEEDIECAGHSATPTCDEDTGLCEQCTYDDERACGTKVCDVAAQVCSTRDELSAYPCDPCVSDRECRDGQVCVPDRLFEEEVGGYVCAWRQSATGTGAPNGACSNVAPYMFSRTATNLGDIETEVCVLGASTCAAHDDYMRPCMSGVDLTAPPAAVADASCGAAGADDGFCARFDAALNQCTVECSTFRDCPCRGFGCPNQYACASGFCEFTDYCNVETGVCSS